MRSELRRLVLMFIGALIGASLFTFALLLGAMLPNEVRVHPAVQKQLAIERILTSPTHGE